MKKRVIIIIALSLVCATLAGCSATAEPIGNPVLVNAMGRWENKSYTNDYFEFSITIPEQWTAYTDEQMQQVIDAENKAAAGNNQDLLKQAEQAKNWTANLFMASSKEYGQQSNATVSVTAQMLGAFSNAFAGSEEDYLSLILNSIKLANPNMTFSPITIVHLGNADLATSAVQVQVQGIAATREIYTKANGGYLVIINTVFTDDAGKKDIDAMLQTINVK